MLASAADFKDENVLFPASNSQQTTRVTVLDQMNSEIMFLICIKRWCLAFRRQAGFGVTSRLNDVAYTAASSIFDFVVFGFI